MRVEWAARRIGNCNAAVINYTSVLVQTAKTKSNEILTLSEIKLKWNSSKQRNFSPLSNFFAMKILLKMQNIEKAKKENIRRLGKERRKEQLFRGKSSKKFIQMKFKWLCVMVWLALSFCFLLTNTTSDSERAEINKEAWERRQQNVI